MTALYRRFRPQCFGALVGQDLIANTLRNAVRENTTVHAYLFTGPRGTGKTSTARILAKALNCANAVNGEPCNICDSCIAITEGNSLDVAELDAASNRGIDAMRDLISRVALGTPGRRKVYIVDEVHMLTVEAANTLLKTLEEPPEHVIFVLATTDPQKILPTIRSRTQQYDFHLLNPDQLIEHLTDIAAQAELAVTPEAIAQAARRGAGSVRDALSALDQIAASGGMAEEMDLGTDDLIEALCGRDSEAAIAWVNDRIMSGLDPRQLARETVDHLRSAFLTTIAPSTATAEVPDRLAALAAQGQRLGKAAAVRAMQVLGQALIDMRDAPDTRIVLEVALLRICQPELDNSLDALLERMERIERGGIPAPSAGEASPAPTPPAVAPAARQAPAPRAAPAAPRQEAPPVAPVPQPVPVPAPPAPAPPQAPAVAPAPAPAGDRLTMESVTGAWSEVIARLPQAARARLRPGRFVSVDAETVDFALPNLAHQEQCKPFREEMERALVAHLGRSLSLRFTSGTPAQPQPPAPAPSSTERVMQAFGGGEVVEP